MITEQQIIKQPYTLNGRCISLDNIKTHYSFPKTVGEWDSRTAGDNESDYIIKRWIITADENYAREICIVAILEVEMIDGNFEQVECYRMPFCACDVNKLTDVFKEVHQWQI